MKHIRKFLLALVALFAAVIGVQAQTNSYGIPDAGTITSSLQTPVNTAFGWWIAICVFLVAVGWVFAVIKRKKG